MRTWLAVAVVAVLSSSCGARAPGRVPVDDPGAIATPPPAVPAPSAPDPAPPALRLPGDVRPTRGELELTIVPDRDRLDGVARYAVDVLRPTSVVWLNATGLEIGGATIDGQPARVIPGGEDFVGLAPATALAPGAATIAITYRAPIDRERSIGVYAEHEGAEWYAYTFFEAIDARRAFPCFDEPGFKIPWRLRFHVREDHVALANTPSPPRPASPAG